MAARSAASSPGPRGSPATRAPSARRGRSAPLQCRPAGPPRPTAPSAIRSTRGTATRRAPRGHRTAGRRRPSCEAPTTAVCAARWSCARPTDRPGSRSRLNPGSNLTPEIFDAAGVFEAGAPPTPDYPQDPACPSPPCHLGPSNGWCTYLVPTSLPQQNPGNSNPANSGSGGLIQFDFDPNLSLHFEANPLAFGESNFGLNASASLTAGATFNIPVVGKSRSTSSTRSRCSRRRAARRRPGTAT